jgi:DNA polymerase-3 subunit epsilon
MLGAEARLRPAMLSAIRKRELLTLAEALGVEPVVELFRLLAAAGPQAASAVAPAPASTTYLKGWRVGLDHADGEDLRHLREMAERHGASVAERLTKTVRFLATRVSGSADQVKTAELGIPIVGPDKAEQILEEAVAAAELAQRKAEAGSAAGRADDADYGTHTWKATEDR